MAKNILINGVDFTDYFTPVGFRCSLQDIIAVKASGQAACMPLTETQQSALLTAIYNNQPVLLQYFDARTGSGRTVEAYMEASETTYKGFGGTGVEYWTGLSVSFSEV